MRESHEPSLRILPKRFEPYVADDGVQWYKFVCDPVEVDRLISMVRSFLQTEGLPAISDDEILSHCQLVKADPNLVECWVEIDAFQYKRAIVKIAYELACEWLGRDYLSDPTGEKLRRFVLEPSFTAPPRENAINGIVDFVRPSQLAPSDEQNYSHTARIGYLNDSLACEINVFNLIRGRIIVTEQRAAYRLFIPRRLDEPPTGTYRIRLLQGVVSKSGNSLRPFSRGVGNFVDYFFSSAAASVSRAPCPLGASVTPPFEHIRVSAVVYCLQPDLNESVHLHRQNLIFFEHLARGFSDSAHQDRPAIAQYLGKRIPSIDA